VQAFGSDWPVFTAEVLRGLQCAVTRATFEGTPVEGWLPEQRLDLEAALAHFTRDAAYAAHEEGDKGTLAPGKLADFVVLGEDVFAVPPGHIAEAGVLLTVMGGEDAYRSEGF
jgi:predicted amidohydrolase YtcJ